MKFNFIVSKWANFYFFAENMSEWHFSCRLNYNQEWLKTSGQLLPKEKNALDDFKKIASRYGFKLNKRNKSKYLGKFFFLYPEKICWQKLKNHISKSEFKKIQNVFKILKPRFEKIWNLKEIKNRVLMLDKSLKQSNYQDLIKELNCFFNNKNIKEINIVGILSPLKGEAITAAGGANIGGNNITLEIPKLKQNSWELEYSIYVLFHEIAHLLLNKWGATKIIEKNIKIFKLPVKKITFLNPHFSNRQIINESIIESLVPFGYLAQKHSNIKKNNHYFSVGNQLLLGENLYNLRIKNKANTRRITKLIVWQNQPLTIFYIKNKKEIDELYIKEFIIVAKKFIKNNKAR